ncbi:hypothetical protein ACN3XK_45990 [Actinomadura welshii]
MSDSALPAHHPDPEIDAEHGYITDAVSMLHHRGISVPRSHLDPCGPVDATIITGDNALVWDESTGWRIGTYVSGRPGERTVLENAYRRGGGVMLSTSVLTELVKSGRTRPPVDRAPDARDGLFDALRRY